jgi:thiol-disulfide isomerase/thioredoxin
MKRAMRRQKFHPYFLGAVFLALVLGLGAISATEAVAAPEANSGRGGETLDLQSLRVRGKITIIEFYSPYCPPCRRLAPMLAQLADKRPDLVVRKVNINRPRVKGIDWRSPLAQQYGIRSVPYFVIFSPRGKSTEGRAATKRVLDYLVEAGILKK